MQSWCGRGAEDRLGEHSGGEEAPSPTVRAGFLGKEITAWALMGISGREMQTCGGRFWGGRSIRHKGVEVGKECYCVQRAVKVRPGMQFVGV